LNDKVACIAREKLRDQTQSDAMIHPVELSSNMASETAEPEVCLAEILSMFFFFFFFND